MFTFVKFHALCVVAPEDPNVSKGHVSRTALGPTQPPIHWVLGALSLGLKRPGREADNSPPSSIEVKNVWSYTSTPSIRLRGVVLSSAQGLHVASVFTMKAEDGSSKALRNIGILSQATRNYAVSGLRKK
jgi:hypothetical protein